ncbi:CHRD domain-containing protein [Nostoc calcicola FACHB-389]|nr:CHRD domain-containing protein [Nostoc calcicola FACHB-3891]MDZ8057514.1 CHRD domain-containing protein [Nostoc sp. EkiNYC01]OKH17735.1 CHRD domain-containing protein [Nostoc calcicola FACHB-389]
MRPKHTLIVICLALMFLVFSYVNQTTMSTWSAVASALNPRNIAAQPTSINFDLNKGQKIDFVYEAFLSPHQEPGEEKDTPSLTPKQFRSTAPSLLRNERKSRGHGVLRFSNDLSKAYVDVKVENVNPKDVVMFHIHCGRPDMLGPILVDFAFSGNIQENLADGVFSVELSNANIEKTSNSGHGIVGAFTVGCPIVPGLSDKVKTIGGMEYIAQQGELYFNLHTKGQTFFGDIRGQLHRA